MYKSSNLEHQLIKKIITNEDKLFDFDFENLDFENLVKISSNQLIITSLYKHLEKFEKRVPAKFFKYIKDLNKINHERNLVLLKELREISNILNVNKIEHTFIKGSACLIFGIYESVGDRLIGDIDVLVRDKDFSNTVKILKKNQYKTKKDYEFFIDINHHYPRMTKDGKLFAIEVHRKILKTKNHYLNSSEILRNKTQVNNLFVPSYFDSFLICIYNYQINDFGNTYLSYNYRTIYDTILLFEKGGFVFPNFANKILSNYFLIISSIGIQNFEGKINYSKNSITRLRIQLRKKFALIFKIEYFIFNKIIFFKTRFKQTQMIFRNKDYLKYIIKKLLSD